MEFPNYFADAESNVKEALFVLFGVPFEKTSSFRHGADKAPFEVRQASWNFERYDLRTGVTFEKMAVHDHGDLPVQDLTSREVFTTTREFTSTLVTKQKIPVAIGGDHSITPGIIAAFPKDIGVLSLDAHMDFRQRYKDDVYNHACVIRRVTDQIPVQNIAVLGIRSAEKEEYDEAQHQGLFFRDAFTISRQGINKTIQETMRKLEKKSIYLTIDIDVIDPAYAPGTSTPEPFGLMPLDVLRIIDAFAPQIIGCDIVEVCPPYDHGQTALLAAKLIRICIGEIWRKQKGLS
jgi:agmatinase